MIKITNDYMKNNLIDDQARLLIKKSGIYIEHAKTSFLKKTWRLITGQYNKCKIAQKALQEFQSLTNKQSITNAEKNLHAIIKMIPTKKMKCNKIREKLLQELPIRTPDSEWNAQEGQDASDLNGEIEGSPDFIPRDIFNGAIE